ncbi:MAG: HD domain-containing protein [Candidatus Magasanikbacteria bacterium]|jgi:uncharacterized protein|nr:HD domain-containing protein [Candidatus Magasanikbacteria bacterium]MBT4071963.1 HD domain-containing protein [Candidatus Magasanikbacteria bacterium]
MNKETIILKTIDFVKETLSGAEGGHDWWHVYRVWKLSKHIAEIENVDIFIVELGALLHDIADSKFHNGDEEIGPNKATTFLQSLKVPEGIITHVENIIANISFKGGNYTQTFQSPELEVIQDADRLDAMGAMGIARSFSFGGFKQNEFHDPEKKPNLNMSVEEDKKKNGTIINHFYEKLLLLKDRMNTNTGKSMAKHRHNFMEEYLNEFYKEWEGKV